MQAREAIRRAPSTIPSGSSIAEAARLMDRKMIGALVVVDGDRPVGIVTDRDLAVRGLGRQLPGDASVDRVMSPDLITLPADADLRKAINIFYSHAIRRLPVDSLVRPVLGQVIFGAPDTFPA